MTRWRWAVVLPVVACALFVATAASEVRAPLHGILAVSAGVLFAVGGAAGSWRAVLSTPLIAALVVSVISGGPAAFDGPAVADDAGCDPSCGIGPQWLAILAAVASLAVTLPGVLVGSTVRHLRRRGGSRHRIVVAEW